MFYVILLLVLGITLAFVVKRKHTRILKPNNFNPPLNSLIKGSYIIEAYCYGNDSKLYFITLNYPTWEEACKTRNEMANKEYLIIEHDGKEYHYSVLSTKISRVSVN